MHHESYAVVKVCTSQPAACLLDKMTRPTTLSGLIHTPLPPCILLSHNSPFFSPSPHSTVLRYYSSSSRLLPQLLNLVPRALPSSPSLQLDPSLRRLGTTSIGIPTLAP